MLKQNTTRRRSKAQIKEDKKKDEQHKMEIQAKLLAWDDMEKQLQQAQSKIQWASGIESGFEALLAKGIMEQQANGSYSVIGDPKKQTEIAQKRRLQRHQMEQESQKASKADEQSQIPGSEHNLAEDIEVDIE